MVIERDDLFGHKQDNWEKYLIWCGE